MLERKGTEGKEEDKVSEWQLLACLLSCLLMTTTTTTTVERIEEGKARKKERIETAKVVCFSVGSLRAGSSVFALGLQGHFS